MATDTLEDAFSSLERDSDGRRMAHLSYWSHTLRPALNDKHAT